MTPAIPTPAAPVNHPPLLEMHAITKRFPGVLALADVDFDVRAGEVHMLLGENGAGKSTLIKIISGVYPPDAGRIVFKGQDVSFGSPGDAQRDGIRVIYQEPNLIPSLTVAENIHLGTEPRRGSLWPEIDDKAMVAGTMELFDRLNLALDAYELVGDLSLAEQQMVAIARALHLSADLVIMDEPTAMFSHHEVAQFFSVVRSLRSDGVGILYVTHRLEEALQLGDRTTILRDGCKIATLPINETTRADLVRLIVGRVVDDFERSVVPPGPEVLRVEGLCVTGGVQDVSFSVHAGEILGITGLVGGGGTGIVRAVFGADPISAGTISLDGQPVRITSPQEAIAHGIGLLTEDRQEQGLVLGMNARENMTLASLESIGPGPFIDREAEGNIVQHYARRLSIPADDLSRKTLFLSGGTQQKVVLSRWLASQCRVLLLDEPTRGIDVGTRAEFYQLVSDLARRGMALVVVSSNLQEIMSLADRVAVVRQGRIAGILLRRETTAAELLSLASAGAPP